MGGEIKLKVQMLKLKTAAQSPKPQLKTRAVAMAAMARRRQNHNSKIKIMGILNVTPDSFSDGGRFFNAGAAVKQGFQMARRGADIIDVGGESSGPNSVYVSEEEELRRVIPVIIKLKKKLPQKVLISVDTYKARIAEEAIKSGAAMVNDVTALRGDSQMADVIAQTGVPIILMYSKDGSARTKLMKKRYKDIVKTVKAFLGRRIRFAQEHGVKKSQIIIDPGMGAFLSADPKYSYEILRRLGEFKSLGCSILIGTSRKSFLAAAVAERLIPTIISNITAILNGANIIRVHDVPEHRKLINGMR